MSKLYGDIDVFQLLKLDTCSGKVWPGFLVKPTGIWLDELTPWDREQLHPNELEAIRGPYTAHDPSKPVLSFPCTGANLKRFLMDTGLYCGEDIDTEPQLHVITPGERKHKGRSPLRLAVEAFLDEQPEGNKEGFYSFLKSRIRAEGKASLKNESYAFFFKSVVAEGSREGVYMWKAKEGKKEGDPGWNRYSGADISRLISRERGNRKK